MAYVDGLWLRSHRRAQGWDVPELARRLAAAAGEDRGTLPDHETLTGYIRRWEACRAGISERYELLLASRRGASTKQSPVTVWPWRSPADRHLLLPRAAEFGQRLATRYPRETLCVSTVTWSGAPVPRARSGAGAGNKEAVRDPAHPSRVMTPDERLPARPGSPVRSQAGGARPPIYRPWP